MQKKMSEPLNNRLNIRKGDVTDAPWIAKLISNMAMAGHLSNDIEEHKLLYYLESQTVKIRSGKGVVTLPCDIWVGEAMKIVRYMPVAAAIVTFSDYQEQPPPHEIWIFGVEDTSHDMGYGKILLSHLKDQYADGGAFVRCAPKSKKFISLAIGLDFQPAGSSSAGVRLVWPGR
jgi:hypothetical protein